MSSLFEIIVSPIKGPLFLIRMEVHKAKVYIGPGLRATSPDYSSRIR